MVWVDGFEPPTSRFQTENSGLTELHPGIIMRLLRDLDLQVQQELH